MLESSLALSMLHLSLGKGQLGYKLATTSLLKETSN